MSGSGRLHSTMADRGDIRKLDMSGKGERTRRDCALIATLTPEQRFKLVPTIKKIAERRRKAIKAINRASTRVPQPDEPKGESGGDGGDGGESGAGATTSGSNIKTADPESADSTPGSPSEEGAPAATPEINEAFFKEYSPLPTSDVCGDTEELVYVDPNADPIDKESTPPELDNALTIMLPLPSVPLSFTANHSGQDSDSASTTTDEDAASPSELAESVSTSASEEERDASATSSDELQNQFDLESGSEDEQEVEMSRDEVVAVWRTRVALKIKRERLARKDVKLHRKALKQASKRFDKAVANHGRIEQDFLPSSPRRKTAKAEKEAARQGLSEALDAYRRATSAHIDASFERIREEERVRIVRRAPDNEAHSTSKRFWDLNDDFADDLDPVESQVALSPALKRTAADAEVEVDTVSAPRKKSRAGDATAE